MKRFEIINPTALYTNKIFNDYINCFSNLKDFFNLPPLQENTPENITPRDKILIEHLLKYNNKFHCGDKTLSNILSLKDKNTFVVATGQQPGPFIGPLYTIYKTITAIVTADNLTKKTGKKFVPVFWIESSDNNTGNISSFFYVNKEHKLKDAAFPFLKKLTGASFSEITLNLDDVNKFISQIVDDLEGERKEDILNFGAIQSGQHTCFVDWFAACMTRLFSSYGLVIIDPRQPEIQKLAKPIFKKELENPLEAVNFIQKAENLLKDKGYTPALSAFPNNTLLFLEEKGFRKKVKFFDPYFQTDNLKFSKDDILSLLDKNPELFSPNVALRPILQDWLLKTSIYIAGPNETAYFAQLKELYQYYSIPMPIILPRYGATIIPDFIDNLISQSNLSTMDFKNRLDKNIQLKLRQNPELKTAFNYLFPQQVLQERRLNIVQFMVKYGTGFVDELMQTFFIDDKLLGKHYLIFQSK